MNLRYQNKLNKTINFNHILFNYKFKYLKYLLRLFKNNQEKMFNREIVLLIINIFSLSFGTDDVKNLLLKMDVTDKCGQMTQLSITAVQKDILLNNDQNPVDPIKLKKAIIDYKIGSLQNTPNDMAQKAEIWQSIIRQIHELSLNTSLKIPLIYGIDSIHGANYIQEAVLFPQPLAQAATFNIEMAETIGEIVARETRAVGIPWNFSPVMDIARQPIWSRIWLDFYKYMFNYYLIK
jgi:hypothetical protein